MFKSQIKNNASENSISLPEHKIINQAAAQNILRAYGGDVDRIKQDFDKIIASIHDEAYKTYLEFQTDYGIKALRHYFTHQFENVMNENPEILAEVVVEHFNELDAFFLSLSQGRKSRAGSTFEYIHNTLFKSLNYPFTEQPVLNGKPDFVLPSKEHYHNEPLDCLVFTAKRTVRERWGQVTVEGSKTAIFFLATIDEKMSPTKLNEMHEKRVFIICPEELRVRKYSDFVNVKSYATFFREFLDPAVVRWKSKNII